MLCLYERVHKEVRVRTHTHTLSRERVAPGGTHSLEVSARCLAAPPGRAASPATTAAAAAAAGSTTGGWRSVKRALSPLCSCSGSVRRGARTPLTHTHTRGPTTRPVDIALPIPVCCECHTRAGVPLSVPAVAAALVFSWYLLLPATTATTSPTNSSSHQSSSVFTPEENKFWPGHEECFVVRHALLEDALLFLK